jgi:hypothetical protein
LLSVSTFVRNSVPVNSKNALFFDNIVPNLISLPGYAPCIKVEKVVLSCVINADSLSDLKLYKVDKPVPSVINVFWFCEVVSFKIDKLVLYEFNVSNTFKPEIYNDPFILVVLSKLVNPLALNEDNNVILLFSVVNPLTFNEIIL